VSNNAPSPAEDWNATYRTRAVETMAWYNPALDEDVAHALEQYNIHGGRALDLGTGPGTQAMHLARLGFSVTATDIAEAAIVQARQKAEQQGLAIDWRQDDILNSRLDQQFDLILDRGCFHTFAAGLRAQYLATLLRILAPGGFFMLKCFSHLQPGDWGPNRFTPEQIRTLFGEHLHIHSIAHTTYQGTLDPPPLALFCVMQRQAAQGQPDE
jgi:2-polyprenyl-3-methyl-5-hydroxy-6-metoxy-1,4-benzoquinol methylase